MKGYDNAEERNSQPPRRAANLSIQKPTKSQLPEQVPKKNSFLSEQSLYVYENNRKMDAVSSENAEISAEITVKFPNSADNLSSFTRERHFSSG